MPELIDDLILPRQPACDGVEFAPPLEGEAFDKLLMAGSGVEPTLSSPLDLQRRRLSYGARRDLPGQTIEMVLHLTASTDCLHQWLRGAGDCHVSPLRQPMNEDGPS